MAHQALARKYRPQTFEDMIGQGAIVQTLRNALLTGRIHPAYVFSGIRGVGKTTAARLLAKGLNCAKGPTPEPCGECDSCSEIKRSTSMDVLEIDAASNTQVEKTRDLMQAARYSPSRDRFRVFIIDEVHMLSPHSFNALLKTLEEPPPHAVFLLATTEVDKIPETIQSRAQVFQFRRVPGNLVSAFLAQVCAWEGIEAEPAALSLIAKSGDGSVRDSLTIFDRILAYADGPITEASAVEVLGVTGKAGLLSFFRTLAEGNPAAVPPFVDELLDRGQSIERFLSDLLGLVREATRLKFGAGAEGADPAFADSVRQFSEEDLLRLWDLLLATQQKMRGSPEVDSLLELQLLKAALLPRILPLDRLLAGLPDGSPSGPKPGASSPREIPLGLSPSPMEPASPPSGVQPQKEEAETPSAEGSTPQGGLRFKALIPFRRMDEDESRSYEDQDDERLGRFREAVARRLPLLQEALNGASLSVDPEGILHLSIMPGAAKAAALLHARERREALESVAREAGLTGRIAVDRSEGRDQIADAGQGSQAPAPKKDDAAVDNILRILGGRVVTHTPPRPDRADGETDAEPE